MFENPRRQASKKFYNKCFENSRSQIVFRTDIFRKLTLGAPDMYYKERCCKKKFKINALFFHLPRYLREASEIGVFAKLRYSKAEQPMAIFLMASS